MSPFTATSGPGRERQLVSALTSAHGTVNGFDLVTGKGPERAVGETLARFAERKLSSPVHRPPSLYRRLAAKLRLWLRGIGSRSGVAPEAVALPEEDVHARPPSTAPRLEESGRSRGAGPRFSRTPGNDDADEEPTPSEAQRRLVAKLVSRTRVRLAEMDPRGQALDDALAESRRVPTLPRAWGNSTSLHTPTREAAASSPPLPGPRGPRAGRTAGLSNEEYRSLLRRTGILARGVARAPAIDHPFPTATYQTTSSRRGGDAATDSLSANATCDERGTP